MCQREGQACGPLDPANLARLRAQLRALTLHERDMTMLALIQAAKTSEHDRRDVFRYRLWPFGELCRACFSRALCISPGTLLILQRHLRANGLTPRTHGNRGRQPANTVTKAERRAIVRWILGFARRVGKTERRTWAIDVMRGWTVKDVYVHWIHERSVLARKLSEETFRRVVRESAEIHRTVDFGPSHSPIPRSFNETS